MTGAALRRGWLAAPGSRWRGHPLTLFGLALLGTAVGLALSAPILPLADPYATDLGQRLLPAGAPGHLLGTDPLGRDVLARLVWGTRTSLAIGVLAVLIAALLGTLVGLVAGYARGLLDTLLMRAIDVLLAFPYLLLALAIVAALGPGLANAMIAIAVVNVPFFARTVRGSVLELGRREFIDAARLTGAGHARMLFRELLPNVLPVVVIMMSTNLGWMILETAGLSFLGLGAQPPSADLGAMLGSAREFLTTAPRVAILPGMVILLLVVGINLLGDALRDALDPRLQGENGAAASTPVIPKRAPEPVPARAEAEALLSVADLSADFPQQASRYRALDGVSFVLHPGERLAVVGESGSGKTIMALSLLGLVPPPGRIAGGAILFQGEDLLRTSEERRRHLRGNRIAYIPQDPMKALNPVLTVGAQLAETLRAHQHISRRAAHGRAVELLQRVRIAEPAQRINAYPHELSGGMRQRALIAMALANDPALLVADEATTALDVTVQAAILALLDALCAEQRAALIFISHDLGVVNRLCSQALVLYAGQVVEQGAMASLLSRPGHPYTRALLACAPQLGRPQKALIPIRGEPPALGALPAGCHFAPRCPEAEPRCTRQAIGLRNFGGGHGVRCLRAEELAPWPR